MPDLYSATESDLEDILRLLALADLPTSGVREIRDLFLVIREGENVLAAGAIEMHGPDGLLRSIVVDAARRGEGLGQQITSGLISRFEGGDVYLLTETAADFFERYGFQHVAREEAPEQLRQSEEFRCLCPESASFMRRSVDSK